MIWLQGEGEVHQLDLITYLCGSINSESYPVSENIPVFASLRLPRNRRKLSRSIKHFVKNDYAMYLIDQLLTLDQNSRISATAFLSHQFFEAEMPCDLADMGLRFCQAMEATSGNSSSFCAYYITD
ncbi:hypothetical protein JTE90_029085 [Oedothorax gibbosus]|uniref:Protein kinase domain-containing protein n=1 Tax=Oedothorax gibbosus TaxID=931172 RepID=A0AAV6UXU1_9ARAC|nr:hypothetical protein JTE90_029085 [Oedothorax gibbosus]